MTNANYHLHNS